MGQGYVGSSGLEYLQQTIRQRVADEMAAKKQDLEMQMAERRMKLSEQEMGMRHAEWGQAREDRQMALDRQKQQDDQVNKNRELTQAEKLNESITPGTMFKKDSPIAGQLRMVGGVQQEDAHLPSTQFNGGAVIPADGGMIRGTLRMANLPGNEEQYRKVATANQTNTLADNARADAALKQSGENQDWKNSISQELATLKGAQQPHQPTPHFQLQPEIDPATGRQTGRYLGFNTLSNSWEPVKGEGPASTKVAPGAAQNAQMSDMANHILPQIDKVQQQADALNKLGLFGPGGSRFRDFVAGKIGAGELAGGSPEAAKLIGQFKTDVGLLQTAVARAHGGARGGGSPTMLKHMEALMDASHADLSTFTGNLEGVRDWMKIYAGKDGAPAAGGGKRIVYDMDGNPVKQ